MPFWSAAVDGGGDGDKILLPQDVSNSWVSVFYSLFVSKARKMLLVWGLLAEVFRGSLGRAGRGGQEEGFIDIYINVKNIYFSTSSSTSPGKAARVLQT